MSADDGLATDSSFSREPTGNLATRASEVFEGTGYYHRSDGWVVGMMLLGYFREYILDNMLPLGGHIYEEAMIAKLMLLYLEWNPHPADGKSWMGISLQKLIDGAEKYKSILREVPPLGWVLSEMDINKEFKDVLKRLLDLNPRRRSSV